MFANHNDESPAAYRQGQGQYIYGDSQQLLDLAAFRAAQVAEQAPGFTFKFPNQGNGDGVTNMRLLTVAGMRQCMLPSSFPTVVGSWIREHPFRICVNFLICRHRHIMVVSSTHASHIRKSPVKLIPCGVSGQPS